MPAHEGLPIAAFAVLAVLVIATAAAVVCQPTHRTSVEDSAVRADVVFRGLAEVAYINQRGPLMFRLLTTYKGDFILHAQRSASYTTENENRQVTVAHAKDECESIDLNIPDQVLFCVLANNTLQLMAAAPWSATVEARVWSALGWSSWSDWSSCSASCGDGVQHRRRRCNRLETHHCFGHSAEVRRCNMFSCEGITSPLLAAERRARWGRVPGRAAARRLRPEAYVWLPASRHPFPDEFSLFVTLRVPRNGSRLGTVISVRSRRQHDAYLSLEVADGKLQLVHATDGGKTEVVVIPVELENGQWHQVALSVRAQESTVQGYGDCRWLRTDVLRRGAFQVPPDADLVIGYLFTGDLEQLTVAPDPNLADLQCSADAAKNDGPPSECESETDSLDTC